MFSEIKKINKKLEKRGLSNSDDFLFSFLDYEDEILSLLKNFSGTKSEIYLREIDNDLTNILKFSSLFSDVTLLNTAPSQQIHHTSCIMTKEANILKKEKSIFPHNM